MTLICFKRKNVKQNSFKERENNSNNNINNNNNDDNNCMKRFKASFYIFL